MTLNKIIATLITFPALAYGAMEADIDIYIITPKTEIIDIGSFFTPNHQAYPLLPAVVRYNLIEYPIFTAQEALGILGNRKWLYKRLQKDTFIAIPIIINTIKSKTEVTISISEKSAEHYSLLPRNKKVSKVPIKLFLVDLSDPKVDYSEFEISPNKEYSLKDVKGRSLFIFIPKEKQSTENTVKTNNYYLPLEVHYHSP